MAVTSKCLAAALCFLALANAAYEVDKAAFEIYYDPLPQDASFTRVGSECTINSVAFPTMYLYMKKKVFTTDFLKMKVGSPKSGDIWDWRGIWTLQKYVQSNSADALFQLKDHESKELATFAPKDYALMPKGGKEQVRGTLWTLNVAAEGSVTTTIRSAVGQQWFLTAQIEDATKTATRMVEMSQQKQGDYSTWKITCDRSGKIANATVSVQ